VLALVVLAVATIFLAVIVGVVGDGRPLYTLFAWVLAGAAVLSIFTVATHFFEEPPCCASIPEPPSDQELYTATLGRDVQSLDRGVLTYSPIRTLKTAATTEFKIRVIDVGRGPQHSKVTEHNGMVVYQEDVPTGGIVGVQIVSCENLKCLSESSSKQLVLSQGYFATWYWQITGGTPGSAKITVRADTYDRGSDQTLHEEIIHFNVKVLPTVAYRHQQSRAKVANTAKSVVGDIVTIGSVATAILAVGGVIGWVVARRRKQGNTNRRKQGNTNRRKQGNTNRRKQGNTNRRKQG